MRLPFSAGLLGLALAVLASAGCAHRSTAAAPSKPTVPWTGNLTYLFDDSIDPAAVGLGVVTPAEFNSLLSDRAQQAELIVPVRIATVTSQTYGQQPVYTITLQVTGAPLVGRAPSGNTLMVSITSTSPAYGVARSQSLQLVGTQLLGLFRTFSQDERQVQHWHLAPNRPDIVEAVRKSLAQPPNPSAP